MEYIKMFMRRLCDRLCHLVKEGFSVPSCLSKSLASPLRGRVGLWQLHGSPSCPPEVPGAFGSSYLLPIFPLHLILHFQQEPKA